MSKLFKYDVVTLIELVESRPCLWDKTSDCFKDKIEKQKSWREIYSFLEEDFVERDKKEQQQIGELISGKWHNIRDSFIKTLKKRSGQGTVKKYLYHDNLQFLLKAVQKDDTQSSIQDSRQLLEPENGKEMATEVGERDDTYATTNTRTFNPRKKPKSHDDIDWEILNALISNKHTPDEDEAFFISITPSVRSMCEEDKLEFRVSVLKLIQDLKSRAKYRSIASCSPPASSSNVGSSFLCKPLLGGFND